MSIRHGAAGNIWRRRIAGGVWPLCSLCPLWLLHLYTHSYSPLPLWQPLWRSGREAGWDAMGCGVDSCCTTNLCIVCKYLFRIWYYGTRSSPRHRGSYCRDHDYVWGVLCLCVMFTTRVNKNNRAQSQSFAGTIVRWRFRQSTVYYVVNINQSVLLYLNVLFYNNFLHLRNITLPSTLSTANHERQETLTLLFILCISFKSTLGLSCRACTKRSI